VCGSIKPNYWINLRWHFVVVVVDLSADNITSSSGKVIFIVCFAQQKRNEKKLKARIHHKPLFYAVKRACGIN